MSMLVLNLTYSQYPILKKIGEDSVVIMTLQQGVDVNKTYMQLKDSIELLNNSTSTIRISGMYSLQRMYDSYSNEYYNRKIEKIRYDNLMDLYIKKDDKHKAQLKNNILLFSIFSILVVFLRF